MWLCKAPNDACIETAKLPYFGCDLVFLYSALKAKQNGHNLARLSDIQTLEIRGGDTRTMKLVFCPGTRCHELTAGRVLHDSSYLATSAYYCRYTIGWATSDSNALRCSVDKKLENRPGLDSSASPYGYELREQHNPSLHGITDRKSTSLGRLVCMLFDQENLTSLA